MGVSLQIWIYEILGGMLLMCQNARVRVYGAWITMNYILCSENYSIFGGLFWSAAGSRRAAKGIRICETRLFLCVTYW